MTAPVAMPRRLFPAHTAQRAGRGRAVAALGAVLLVGGRCGGADGADDVASTWSTVAESPNLTLPDWLTDVYPDPGARSVPERAVTRRVSPTTCYAGAR